MSEPAPPASAAPGPVTQEQLDAAQRAWAETDPFNGPLYRERGDAYEA